MNFLVTGGAGFIGSNFLIYCINKHNDDRYICLDKLTYAGNLDNLKEIENKENYKFIKGDICDAFLVDKIFREEKIDVVINFAAESHVDKSIVDSSEFIETNVRGVQVLLEASRKYRIKKFHQVSTDEVYGDVDLSSLEIFNEESTLNPSNPYSATKASADMLVLSYNRTYNLPISISRSSNNYGPRQHVEKLVPKVIERALNNQEIPIHGTGRNIRDWLYVGDYCRAIDLIVRNGKNREIYNVAGNNKLSNLEITKKILFLLNKDEKLITFVEDRLANDRKYNIDSLKLEREFNWKREYSLDKGLENTIEWYLKGNK